MIILDFGWEQMCHQYLPFHCCLGLNTLLAHPLGMSVKISLMYFCKLFKIFYSVIIPPLPLWNLFLQRCPESNTNEQLIRLKCICKHKYIYHQEDRYILFSFEFACSPCCPPLGGSSWSGGLFRRDIVRCHFNLQYYILETYLNISFWGFTSASVESCCWSLIVLSMVAAWFEEHLKC